MTSEVTVNITLTLDRADLSHFVNWGNEARMACVEEGKPWGVREEEILNDIKGVLCEVRGSLNGKS
jgi:hypothetical protein